MSILRLIYRDLRDYFKLKSFQTKWLKNRKDNFTKAGTIFPMDKVVVGKCTYGVLNVHYYNRPIEKLTIGSYCSIADNVHFFTGGEHDFALITTYPFKNKVTRNDIQEAISKGPITLGDDVWIGNSVMILSGVTIGQGAVVGAGSIVAKDIPPYAVFYNGEVQRYRFSSDIIQRLCQLDLSSLNYEDSPKKFDILYEKINSENIESIIESLNIKEMNI